MIWIYASGDPDRTPQEIRDSFLEFLQYKGYTAIPEGNSGIRVKYSGDILRSGDDLIIFWEFNDWRKCKPNIKFPYEHIDDDTVHSFHHWEDFIKMQD